jgi:hypothetical protein
MRLIGVLGVSESASTNELTFCSNALNLMLKSWQAEGLNLWTRQEATVFLTADTSEYSLPGASGSDTVVETELSVAAATSATSLTVDTTTGMTASDVILIELDDGTLDSTTIVSVDSSTTLTITTGLSSAAAVDNNVYTYTTAIARPLDILNVRYRNDDLFDRELEKLTYEEYQARPSKDTTSGTPTSFTYAPGLDTGKLYVYPRPDSVDGRLKITYTRVVEDLDSATDNADIPEEWLEAVVYGLALRIAPAFGKDQKAIQTIGPIAENLRQALEEWDNEKSSVFIRPDYED